MNERYKDIKVIGFDLDQTLYPKMPEIDEEIQRHLYKKIAEHRFCSLEEAKELFFKLYKDLGSGSRVLMSLKVPHARDIVQEALEKSDIAQYLKPNQELNDLLVSLRKKYEYLALITGSSLQIAFEKLKVLQINPESFHLIITGEVSKSNGDAYKHWLAFYQEKDSSLKPENFLYIGDRKIVDVDIPQSLGIKAVLVNIKEVDMTINADQFYKVTDIKNIFL